MPRKQLISLNLHREEVQLLDELVEIYASKSVQPSKVNRSTVVSDLMMNAMKVLRGGTN